MTPTEADDEMVAGYVDGSNRDNPEPSANRSNSYRHGFRNARNDLAGRAGGPPALLRQRAQACIDRDLGA